MHRYRDAKRTRDERLGGAFKLDERFENLLAMTEARREDILAGSSALRISYGYYLSGRSAALRLEQERTS